MCPEPSTLGHPSPGSDRPWCQLSLCFLLLYCPWPLCLSCLLNFLSFLHSRVHFDISLGEWFSLGQWHLPELLEQRDRKMRCDGGHGLVKESGASSPYREIRHGVPKCLNVQGLIQPPPSLYLKAVLTKTAALTTGCRPEQYSPGNWVSVLVRMSIAVVKHTTKATEEKAYLTYTSMSLLEKVKTRI